MRGNPRPKIKPTTDQTECPYCKGDYKTKYRLATHIYRKHKDTEAFLYLITVEEI